MVSGNVLYMTRELGGSRGWAGGMEGVDRSLLGHPWQGSCGDRGQAVRAEVSFLEVTWKATQGGGYIGMFGTHQPCVSGQSTSRPPSPFPPLQHGMLIGAGPI